MFKHIQPQTGRKSSWLVKLGVLIVIGAVAYYMLGCAPRYASPLTEAGPVVVSETSTINGVTSSSTSIKSRAAAELEFRLAIIAGETERAKAIAFAYHSAYGGYPTYGGGGAVGVNTTAGSQGGGYVRPYNSPRR